MITIAEYRKILGDQISAEKQIKERINYLEALCRNIIKSEIENYVKAPNTNRTKENKPL